MVVIGGITRLTESGLSITEWKPISGTLPPLSAAEWETAFEQYKKIPEYKLVNKGMSLEEFKKIYWWEYIHRLWGRIIGLCFLLPFLFFWRRGYLHPDWIPPLCVLFILGLNQGFLGWLMVASGLTQNTDVSQYRLTGHLILALIIYCYMFWVALHIRKHKELQRDDFLPSPLLRPATIIFGLFWITLIAGGFMAGLNAGLVFDTFPTHNGEVIPGGLFKMQPWYINFFENATTAHFTHRWLGIALLLGILWIGWMGFKAKPERGIKLPLIHVCVMACLQAALGVSTVTHHVAIPVAAAHQFGAVILLSFFMWLLFALKYRRAEYIR